MERHQKCVAYQIILILIPKEGRHQKLHQSHIKKSDAAVLNVVSTIQSFTNAWRAGDKNRLYCLASGSLVSIDVENDALGIEDLGRSLREEFIIRFKVRSKFYFFDPVKRQKLRTMEAASKKVKLPTSQGKVVQFQEQSDLAFTSPEKCSRPGRTSYILLSTCDSLPWYPRWILCKN